MVLLLLSLGVCFSAGKRGKNMYKYEKMCLRTSIVPETE